MRIRLTIRDMTAVPAHREVVVECPAGTRAEELRAALGASQLTAAGHSVADSSLGGGPHFSRGRSSPSTHRRQVQRLPPPGSSGWSTGRTSAFGSRWQPDAR